MNAHADILDKVRAAETADTTGMAMEETHPRATVLHHRFRRDGRN